MQRSSASKLPSVLAAHPAEQHQQQTQLQSSEATLSPTTPEHPYTILIKILQLVSVEQGLGTCACVSTTWDTVVRMTFSHLSAVPDPYIWKHSLQPWLAQCNGSGYLTSLTLSTSVTEDSPGHDFRLSRLCGTLRCLGAVHHLRPSHQGCLRRIDRPINITYLPTQLRKLSMENCSLFTEDSSSISWCGLLATKVTAMTHLSLESCDISAAGVVGIGSMTALQHLNLTWVNPTSSTALQRLVTLLPSLQQLTHLTLVGDDSSMAHRTVLDSADARDEAFTAGHYCCSLSLHQGLNQHYHILQNVSFLTALQDLSCEMPLARHRAVLQGLSVLRQLTALKLEGTNYTFTSSSLCGMTSLKRLQLRDAGSVCPSALRCLTGLQHLELTDTACALLPEPEQLLAALPQLQQLTYLRLDHEAVGHTFTTLQAYSALTASTVLQELHITLPTIPAEYHPAGVELVPGLVRNMFPAARLLPDLRVLRVGGGHSESHTLTSIAEACPALSELYIDDLRVLVAPEQQLPALHTMPQLENLAGTVRSSSAKAAAIAMAQLTKLQELTVVTRALADDLQLLTTLTRLTKLYWHHQPQHASSHSRHTEPCDMPLVNTAASGEPPNVWQQILQGVENRTWPSLAQMFGQDANQVVMGVMAQLHEQIGALLLGEAAAGGAVLAHEAVQEVEDAPVVEIDEVQDAVPTAPEAAAGAVEVPTGVAADWEMAWGAGWDAPAADRGVAPALQPQGAGVLTLKQDLPRAAPTLGDAAVGAQGAAPVAAHEAAAAAVQVGNAASARKKGAAAATGGQGQSAAAWGTDWCTDWDAGWSAGWGAPTTMEEDVDAGGGMLAHGAVACKAAAEAVSRGKDIAEGLAREGLHHPQPSSSSTSKCSSSLSNSSTSGADECGPGGCSTSPTSTAGHAEPCIGSTAASNKLQGMWSASLYWQVYLAAAAVIATVFLLQLTDGAVHMCAAACAPGIC